jgi:phosphoglycerate dehydrogenase-like enzyme
LKIAINLTKNKERYQKVVDAIKRKLDKKIEKVGLVFCPTEKEVFDNVSDIEVIACYDFQPELLKKAKNLKWIHLGLAGVDSILFPELLKSGIVITNSRGIHSEPMTEFVFGLLLNYTKRLDVCREARVKREWKKWEIARTIIGLSGKTLGVIGFGAVGKEICKKAKAFNMFTIAVKNRPETKPEYVDELYLKNELEILLKKSDFIVVAVPLTNETYHLLGEKEFSLMKPSVYLINVSRGKVIDEKVLIEYLKEKKIRGASLDVFETEPLQENSAIYGFENVFITPHISGNFPEYVQKVGESFAENLRRYVDSENLLNVINKDLRY